MLQILGWMLCAFMVLKGVEILLIVICSSKDNSWFQLLLGWGAFFVAIALCIVFIGLLDSQAGITPRLRP